MFCFKILPLQVFSGLVQCFKGQLCQSADQIGISCDNENNSLRSHVVRNLRVKLILLVSVLRVEIQPSLHEIFPI